MIQPGGLSLWVHPVFKSDVREISGCADVIYINVSEPELKPHGDTPIFKNAIKIIHDHSLKVVVSLGTGGRFSSALLSPWHLTHPETWLKFPSDAATTKQHFLGTDILYSYLFKIAGRERCCVNNPDFIAYTKEFYANLFDNYDVDGVGFDEPLEFPCVCKHCMEKFKKVKGKELSGKTDEENLEFQAESLVEYISLISDLAKAKGLTTACVVGSRPEVPFHSKLAQVKNLDIFGPDPYWIGPGSKHSVSWVGEMTKAYREICDRGNKLLWVVIQGHNIPSGREHEIYKAGKLAAENGTDILCGYFHWRGTENPELTWDTIHRMLIDFGPKRRPQ